MVFFPECFDFIGRTKEETISLSMDEDSKFVQNFRDLAKKHGIWISLGGLHHKVDYIQKFIKNVYYIKI